ncbi:MAG: hypothetical protein QF724_05495 [Planctomycetota bacterium]|jgi:hypothetical protein|nr:hypothetical protein [Planctomycetota bacterium]MDP6520086.1 hypothetical protein [Planctomycetota bacterium]MDP6838374.1 hypothetical protein [Planctomycetota bacterium]MDP6955721.1 hypothetical protein [Planctomycetota bacterium]
MQATQISFQAPQRTGDAARLLIAVAVLGALSLILPSDQKEELRGEYGSARAASSQEVLAAPAVIPAGRTLQTAAPTREPTSASTPK